VQLRGETLKMYDRKRKLGLAVPKLAQYCSMATFYTHAMRPPFVHRLVDNPNSWASKIGAWWLEETLWGCGRASLLWGGTRVAYCASAPPLREAKPIVGGGNAW
jgi:hypothetical protein